MEIIKQAPRSSLSFFAKGRESAMGAWIRKLEPGDALRIMKADWKGNRAPYYLANYITKKKGWEFEMGRLPGNEGWMILRVK